MSSLQDTIQRMQIQQLENAVQRSEHEIREARAKADLAEWILKRAKESDQVVNLPRAGMS